MKPLLLTAALLCATTATASEQIADKYPGSMLYDEPVEVIPGVWSAIGATAPFGATSSAPRRHGATAPLYGAIRRHGATQFGATARPQHSPLGLAAFCGCLAWPQHSPLGLEASFG